MIRVSLAVTLVLALAALTVAPARADTWRFDPDHTQIRVSWNHLGVSRQGASFTRAYGTLEFTPTDPTRGRVEVTIPVDGLTTGNAAFDKHLKSNDFFGAETHPYIKFTSTAVRQTGPRTGVVVGDLTIRDVTKPVELNVTWNYTGEHPLAAVNPVYEGRWVSGFSASTMIARSDFGIGRGAPLVSDDVEIRIEAEFLRRK